jgi:hypothetical protein
MDFELIDDLRNIVFYWDRIPFAVESAKGNSTSTGPKKL